MVTKGKVKLEGVLHILSVIMLLGCNGSSEKINKIVAYPDDLNPSMFACKNITSSNIKNFLPYSNLDYSDSVKKITYKTFDSIQDAKYLQPLMPDLGLWAFQTVRLVSWQNRIGELQPIIVTIDGEDYDGMEYVILNKNFSPVSEITIRGGWSVNDDDSSGYMIHTITHATFSNDTLMLFKLHIRLWVADSIKHPSITDSITYRAIMKPDGKIDVIQQDSVRYTRLSDSDFYRY